MTIKPVVNQKSAEKKEPHQESPSSGVRTNHRNVLVQKTQSNDGQSPQRRSDVFEEISRHRRSPLKNLALRSKRDHHKQREQREKHSSSPRSPHAMSTNVVPSNKSPKHGCSYVVGSSTAGSSSQTPSQVQSPASALLNSFSLIDDCGNKKNEHGDPSSSGYNSGDEHLVPKETLLTSEEWKHRDEQFIKAMSDRGFVIHDIIEDGACLFRAISLQVFGDQEMHEVIRQQTMDYIYQNREYFAHFVTEDITSYVKRKRHKESHGNHIEIQAMSEIYNRPVELYCYQTTPTNIFNSEQINNGYDPLRLSYQRGSHYNAIMDPYNASVGVGLGLAGYKPESQTREAIRLSEQLEIEQTMFEDKLKTTDWEATNEAIEEQIARESYLQWCRDNMHRANCTTTTVTKSTSTLSSSNSTLSSATITSSSSLLIDNSFGSPSTGGECNTKRSSDIDRKSPNRIASNSTSTTSIQSIGSSISNNISLRDCYDSDDSDMSSTSQSMDLYKNAKKLKYSLSSPTRSRRLKRRHRDSTENTKCVTDDSLEICYNAKRTKPATRLWQQESTTTQLNQQQKQNVSMSEKSINSASSSNYGVSSSPCTSKQAAQFNMPVSLFYQSLLESSYTKDGIGQLSESEMILKAIHLSRVDFFENVKRQSQTQTDEQHNSNGAKHQTIICDQQSSPISDNNHKTIQIRSNSTSCDHHDDDDVDNS